MSAIPPKADMCGATRDVRFGPIADMRRTSFVELFDDRVSSGEHGRRNCEAQCLSGFKIDHQLVLGRRLHRKVGGLLALEDAIDIGGRLPVRGDSVGAVRDQAAVFHEVSYEVHRGQSVLGRQSDDQLTMKDRKSTRLNSSHLGISYAV